GIWPLFTYTGTQLTAGQYATLTNGTITGLSMGSATVVGGNNPGEVDLIVTGNINALIWKGPIGGGAGNWDTTSSFWTSNNVPATYSDGQFVFFDDSANGSGTITANISNGGSGVQPLGMSFNNSTRSIIINGASSGDGIKGTGALTKSGA